MLNPSAPIVVEVTANEPSDRFDATRPRKSSHRLDYWKSSALYLLASGSKQGILLPAAVAVGAELVA